MAFVSIYGDDPDSPEYKLRRSAAFEHAMGLHHQDGADMTHCPVCRHEGLTLFGRSAPEANHNDFHMEGSPIPGCLACEAGMKPVVKEYPKPTAADFARWDQQAASRKQQNIDEHALGLHDDRTRGYKLDTDCEGCTKESEERHLTEPGHNSGKTGNNDCKGCWGEE